MKYIKKKYERPFRPWDNTRLDAEREILTTYGLRSKKELWRTQETLRKYRRLARRLAARENKEQEALIISKLVKMGVLQDGATLGDILALKVQDLLERRLQTQIFRMGAANTVKHARQMIVHGKVRMEGRKVVYPSLTVMRGEESKISISQGKSKVIKHVEEKPGTEGTVTGA